MDMMIIRIKIKRSLLILLSFIRIWLRLFFREVMAFWEIGWKKYGAMGIVLEGQMGQQVGKILLALYESSGIIICNLILNL
jgi:hypothetical protein